MFTADHYIKLAEVIRRFEEHIFKDSLVKELTDMFQKDNPKFDSIKFIDACYTEDWG